MSKPVVDILMYHSISSDDVATAIDHDTFRRQMDTIEELGIPVISLDDLLLAREGKIELAPVSVIITFDDAFTDFAERAFPIIQQKGFDAIVYVPTGCVGLQENWRGALVPPRNIMGWEQIKELSDEGIHFGSHTITHPDLNELKTLDLVDEIRKSQEVLEDKLGIPVHHFAPPYGLADYFARSTTERLYKTSVGTIFERAEIDSDIMDLPRLEMFYFKKISRWHDHLSGNGAAYMSRRRTLRQAREAMSRPWERV